MSKDSIRLINSGMTEVGGEIVATGFLDAEGLGQLKVGDYQREVLKSTGVKNTKRTGLQMAVARGARLPTIVLGMRGQKFRSSGPDMLLYDDVYIVDGLQRTFALKSHAEDHPEAAHTIMQPVEIRFDTSYEIEKELFQTLNLKRTPMSPNIILRNGRDTNKAILTLYGLSTSDSTSPLFDRVQWTQRRGRSELLTALAVARVIDDLHKHVKYPQKRVIGSGIFVRQERNNGAGILGKMQTLDRRSQAVGLKMFRENVIEYFEAIDVAFGLRKIEYGELATHLRGNFLLCVAQLFSEHEDFWQGNQLVVPTAHKKKLAAFAIDDPNVQKLAGGSNTTKVILYSLLVEHMNKGMKKNHLRARRVAMTDLEEDEAA